jgi:nucleoid DNA-binding protein
MNKGDLINGYTKVVATRKRHCSSWLCICSISKALKKKETVTLVGLGTFR